jgi:hypothetical protein
MRAGNGDVVRHELGFDLPHQRADLCPVRSRRADGLGANRRLDPARRRDPGAKLTTLSEAEALHLRHGFRTQDLVEVQTADRSALVEGGGGKSRIEAGHDPAE